jgi:hypothetical protein
MDTTTVPRHSKLLVLAQQVSPACVKCGAAMLYHDFDPWHFHNGLTCLMCGTEQPLKNGAKSLIDPNARREKGRGRPIHAGMAL